MSGSSISRNRRSRPSSTEPSLERLADGERRQRLEPGPRRGVELGDRRQDEVELLGDDVGDRLAAQRRVEDVGRDLGVEGDRRRVARRGRRRSAATSSGLTSWPTSGIAELDRGAGGASPRRRGPRPRPRARPCRRARAPAASRAAVAGRRAASPTPTAGWAASHGSRAAIRSPRVDLDARRVGDRRGERAPAGRPAASRRRAPRTRRRRVVGLGPAADRPTGRPSAAAAGRARPRRSRATAGARRPRPAAAPVAPSPSPTAAPLRRPAPPAPTRRSRRRAGPRPRRRRVSPVIAGRRSMSVRNSYSRKSRMTVSRS